MSAMRWLFILLFSACVFSCSSDKQSAPDVSNINVKLESSRFDIDLYAIDTNHITDGLNQLLKKYPDFLNYFLDTVMAYNIRGNYNDTADGIKKGLRVFLTYHDFVHLEDTIKYYYPDTKDIDNKLTGAFKLVKYYLPNLKIPRVIYLNMGLSNWPSFPVDSTTLCIGLDMFLGEQYPYYKSVGVPQYMAAHLRKSYIPVSVFSSVYKNIYPFVQDDRPLLDMMIQRGKEQYFLHKILPDLPDSVLFGFTGLQLKWCAKNEANVYNYFIQQNLLYDRESVGRISYVNEGPFAKGMEPVTDTVKYTPGNVGTWLGYKIVSSYMNTHPKTTLATLLATKEEPAKFLETAKYRPR